MKHHIRENLYLEILSTKHVETIYTVVTTHRTFLSTFLMWVSDVKNLEDIERFVMYTTKLYQLEGQLHCAIMYDERCIGIIHMQNWNRLDRQTSIGYWLSPTYTRQGIMTDVLRDFCHYLFERKKLHRLEVHIAERNEASIRVAEKIGFQFEGIRRHAEWCYDHFVNHRMYSLLEGEIK